MSALTRIMNKGSLLKFLSAFLFAACLSSGAVASQGATFLCLNPDWEGGCPADVWELRVTISSDEDVGQTGAYGIGVRMSSGRLAYWTPSGGFQAYNGGLVQPLDGIRILPAGNAVYTVYRGSRFGLCGLSAGESFEVWAGRGIVPGDKLTQINWLLSQRINLPADHIKGAYIYQNAQQSPWKVGMVFSWSCGAS